MATFRPREQGESRYQYEKARSLALFGKTPYQRRLERGLSRGLTISEARGHAPPQTITEQSYTRTRVLPNIMDIIINQRNYVLQRAYAAGYTPETTMLTDAQLTEVYPLIEQMNAWASPEGQLTPFLIWDAMDAESTGDLDDGWTYTNIKDKYRAMYDYHMARIKAPPGGARIGKKTWSSGSYMPDNRFGRMRFMRGRNNYVAPIQWWWYH